MALLYTGMLAGGYGCYGQCRDGHCNNSNNNTTWSIANIRLLLQFTHPLWIFHLKFDNRASDIYNLILANLLRGSTTSARELLRPFRLFVQDATKRAVLYH